MSYCGDKEDWAMKTKDELEKRVAELNRQYSGTFSMLSMMEKGTKLEDLVKMRKEQLDPIKAEIAQVEKELRGAP
jgi:uncharacterized protein YoxC